MATTTSAAAADAGRFKRGRSSSRTMSVTPAVRSYVARTIRASRDARWFEQGISTTVTTSGSLTGITAGIVPGDSQNERTSGVINYRNAWVNLTFTQGDAIQLVRMIVFFAHKQEVAGGNLPTVHSHFDATSFGCSVLTDRLMTFNQNVAGVATLQSIKWSRRFRGRSDYGNAGSGAAHYGNLYVWIVSDSSLTPNPGVDGYAGCVYDCA